MLKRQAEQLNKNNIIDYYTKFIYDLNYLSSYDKKFIGWE